MYLCGHMHAYVPYNRPIGDVRPVESWNRCRLPPSLYLFLSFPSSVRLFLLFRVAAHGARDTSAASGRVRDVICELYCTGGRCPYGRVLEEPTLLDAIGQFDRRSLTLIISGVNGR